MKLGPAGVRNCGIIEGVVYEAVKEETMIGFSLGFTEQKGVFGLEVYKGSICIQAFKFFNKILSKYAVKTEGPKTKLMIDHREVIESQWSIFRKLTKSISTEELLKRQEEVDNRTHELLYEALNDVKKRIGLS
ncbi:hypothetical protein AC480_01390 [miscellaneous Crenarchaeota group archaeon SMTZ1-55]|nr:MAG: hypothetical protein AC480_01390 [miscellaneous Crenarchaeota group archaeon SMTZ1-55]